MGETGWHLHCLSCGKRYSLKEPRFSCTCDSPLSLLPPEGGIPERWPAATEGIRRYRKRFPHENRSSSLDLGERVTPLLEYRFDSRRVLLKMESLLPTGSFKDRGFHVLVNQLVAWGIPEVVADSSGNAACSLAAYCARAGIRAHLHVPRGASPGKLNFIRAHGAKVHEIPGDRSAVRKSALLHAREIFYAGHVTNPLFLQGIRTLAYEIHDQMAGVAPGTVVVPIGNGTLLLGLWYGFQDLLHSRCIDRLPRLVGVQALACSPLATAFRKGTDLPERVPPGETVAEGIAIPEPTRGAEILRAVRESGGNIGTVSEEAILATHRQMARGGFLIEPTSATAVAGAFLDGFLPEGSDPVVVVLTGSGLKTLFAQ